MKTIILFFIVSIFLVADSVKTDLTVTFHDLTLEQASKLEKIINAEFKDYKFDISISGEKKEIDIWNPFQLYDEGNLLPLPR